MQLRFGVIWEGPTVESTNIELISQFTSMDSLSSSSSSSSSYSLVTELETRRRYYPQNVYQTNFQKYPLLLVTYKTYVRDIKPFILNHLKDLQSKNSDNGESNHRIITMYNLQYFLNDLGKPIGRKVGIKILAFDFVKNSFASTITDYQLCWFGCICYLTNPKRSRNSENEGTRMYLAKQCFFHFYDYQNLSEENKKLKLKDYNGFDLAKEIERFMSFFQTNVNIFKSNDKQNFYSKQHSYICSSPTETLYTLNVGLIDFS
jgi:hypothetical protein